MPFKVVNDLFPLIDPKGNKFGDMGIFMECRFEIKKLTKTKPNLNGN